MPENPRVFGPVLSEHYLVLRIYDREVKVNSPICKRQFDEHLTGIGVPNLHLRDIKEVNIPIPSLNEQHEIVRIIDSMSEKWRAAQTAAEQVIEQIDAMKKSILARAFRGELGTNDPADESAEELLKRIL